MSSKNLKFKKVKFGNTERYKFGKIDEVMDIPYLVEVQKNSYQNFITKGICREYNHTIVFKAFQYHFYVTRIWIFRIKFKKHDITLFDGANIIFFKSTVN